MITSYITKKGDRWDLIAFKAYGDANKLGPIIRANPAVPLYDELPGGLTLNIPVMDRPKVSTEQLPPWKR